MHLLALLYVAVVDISEVTFIRFVADMYFWIDPTYAHQQQITCAIASMCDDVRVPGLTLTRIFVVSEKHLAAIRPDAIRIRSDQDVIQLLIDPFVARAAAIVRDPELSTQNVVREYFDFFV